MPESIELDSRSRSAEQVEKHAPNGKWSEKGHPPSERASAGGQKTLVKPMFLACTNSQVQKLWPEAEQLENMLQMETDLPAGGLAAPSRRY